MRKLLAALFFGLLLGFTPQADAQSSSSGPITVGAGLTATLGTCNVTPVYTNGLGALYPQICPFSYSATHTVLSTEMGGIILATSGTWTLTLPAIGIGFQNGQAVCVENDGTGTITIASSSTIFGITIVTPMGQVCALSDGTAWHVGGSSGFLAAITALGSSLSISGGNTLNVASAGVTAAMLASGAATSNLGASSGDITGSWPTATVARVNGDANVAFKDANQAFTKGQGVTPVALTYVGSGTTVIDFSLSNAFTITLTGSTSQMGNPSNVTAGQCIQIYITQDGTGGRLLTWASHWKFSGGAAPTLSAGAGAVDVLSACAQSSTFIPAQAILNVE